ncbi:MAG: DNA/RNA nuclease SfsA [Rhodospirillaceae bacterium]|nr:DNA/RNA nuclease SfsA [Rhodospirillaceae bacterium]
MKFPAPLQKATLLKRYKRFLSDMELPDGSEVVAHCANPGSMMGLVEPGSEVWLSANTNPKAKLDWRWELVRVDGQLVGINTRHPNRIAELAVAGGAIAELTGYGTIRREVKYGENSRIDLLLEDDAKPTCYVEIKNVTLKREGFAEFPDSVTKRGAKHLGELANMVAEGHRAVMFYLAQRNDCEGFRLAPDLDPGYAEAFEAATAAGVEAICYACEISTDAIEIARPLPIVT